MKTLLKIIGGIVVLLILLLPIVCLARSRPKNRRPGLWITGPVATASVTEWSFTDPYFTVRVQTNQPLVRHHALGERSLHRRQRPTVSGVDLSGPSAALSGALRVGSVRALWPPRLPQDRRPDLRSRPGARDRSGRARRHDSGADEEVSKLQYRAMSGFNVFRVTNG